MCTALLGSASLWSSSRTWIWGTSSGPSFNSEIWKQLSEFLTLLSDRAGGGGQMPRPTIECGPMAVPCLSGVACKVMGHNGRASQGGCSSQRRCLFGPWDSVQTGLTQPRPYLGSALPTTPQWPLWQRWGASDGPLRVFMLGQRKKPQAFFQQLLALANWADSVTAGPLCCRPYVKLLSGTKGKS